MVSTRNSRNHFTSATTERSVSTKAFLVGWNTLQSICNVLPATLLLLLLLLQMLLLLLMMHMPKLLMHAAHDKQATKTQIDGPQGFDIYRRFAGVTATHMVGQDA